MDLYDFYVLPRAGRLRDHFTFESGLSGMLAWALQDVHHLALVP